MLPVMERILEAAGWPDTRSWLDEELPGGPASDGLTGEELEERLRSTRNPLRLMSTDEGTVEFVFEEGVLAALQQLAGGAVEVWCRYADGEVVVELRLLARIGSREYPITAGLRAVKRPALVPTLGELAEVMAKLAAALAGDLRRLEEDLAGLAAGRTA